MFDIVVPLGPDDHERFRQALPFTMKNIVGYRKIYVVTQAETIKKLVPHVTGVTFIDEAIYPFGIEDLTPHIGAIKRRGWYFQQLLKLYAGFILPGILPRWLIIDADTFFLKPVEFIRDGKCCYNIGNEYMKQYFVHLAKLLPGLHRVDERLGGITHHMIFEARFVKELFERVEAHHKKPFWRAFMDCIEPYEYDKSGASEYEMYFNYLLIYHRDEIVLRPLRWENTYWVDTTLDRDYISAHEWMHQMFLEATKQPAR